MLVVPIAVGLVHAAILFSGEAQLAREAGMARLEIEQQVNRIDLGDTEKFGCSSVH